MPTTLPDPRHLTRAQRAALVLAGGRPLLRGARRWFAGEASFAPETIRGLIRLGLAHEATRHGRVQVEPTGAGRAVLAVIAARQERQAGRADRDAAATTHNDAGDTPAGHRKGNLS